MAYLLKAAHFELKAKGITVPETEEEIFQAAYEACLEDNFLQAHMFRLRKDWRNFSDDDWRTIKDISGIEKIVTNIGAMMACLSRGIITPEDIV